MENTALILGCDPGKTSGLVLLSVERGNIQNCKLVKSVELCWEDRLVGLRAIFHDLVIHPNPIVVYESFLVYKGVNLTGSPIWSAQIIGMLEMLADIYGVPKQNVHSQAAHMIHSKAHQAATGSKLTIKIQEEHLPYLDDSLHKKDAYCHARRFALVEYGN